MLVLPKRNSGSYLKTAPKANLKTNLFKVQFSEKVIIVIYSLALQPCLPDDSAKVNQIIQNCKIKLQEQLGNFLTSGKTIFSCTTPKSGKAYDSIIKVESILRGQKYLVILKPVRFIDLSALNSHKTSDTFLPLNFLSNLIKKFFKTMKYVSVGKNGKYFNPKSQNILQGSGIILFEGYETKFNICQSGIYLQVQSMVRIIQNRTALEEIDSIYSKNKHLNKDEKREAVKQQLIGKVVMANYGNSRIWLIKEIIFDFDLQSNKISQDNNMNFVEYYQKSYGIQITKKKQPVFKAVMNGTKKSKVQKESILIPQFLLLSGLPEDFDERKRREISQYTIINPDQKMRRIEHLISDFNNDKQNFSANSVQKSLGIKICPLAENIQAIMLPPPMLQLGKGQSIQKQKSACFQLFNKQIYRHDIPVNVVVIVPNDFQFEPIQKLFSSTCKNLCIKYSLNVIRLNYHDSKKVLVEIERIIEDSEGKFDNFDLNWFILPPNMKAQYKNIKRLSMKSQNPKVTQVALTSTLGKKGFASILTKILIQISSKIGNIPWAPKLPTGMPQKAILIGVDSCRQSKNNVVAYCATINKEMTKFHTNYLYEPKSNSRLNGRIGEVISDCITAYAKVNMFMPEEIIILKAEMSQGEKQEIVTAEINQIKLKLKEMNLCSVKLTFMTANKNSKQRFFAQGRSIINPGFGTLINNKVVSKNYDFFLISQHCNRGTVKPIHYNVLYTDSKMQQGVLQELMFCQSFNYMNWSGSVRVPSVLQYSTKLCSFIADNINRPSQTKQLNDHLYFI